MEPENTLPTQFLVFLREPDGRRQPHDPAFTSQHQQDWQTWLTQWGQRGNLAGGQSLTLNGLVLPTATGPVQTGPHRVGLEIVGGYLMLKAATLDEAVAIMRSCPVFDAGGYAEIREIAAPAY